MAWLTNRKKQNTRSCRSMGSRMKFKSSRNMGIILLGQQHTLNNVSTSFAMSLLNAKIVGEGARPPLLQRVRDKESRSGSGRDNGSRSAARRLSSWWVVAVV